MCSIIISLLRFDETGPSCALQALRLVINIFIRRCGIQDAEIPGEILAISISSIFVSS